EKYQAVEHKQGVGFTIALRGDALVGGLENDLFAFEAAIEVPDNAVYVQDLSLNLKRHSSSPFPATRGIAAIVASSSRSSTFSTRIRSKASRSTPPVRNFSGVILKGFSLVHLLQIRKLLLQGDQHDK